MTTNTRQFRISVDREIGYTRLVASGRLVLGQGADIALWLPYLTSAEGRTIDIDLKAVTEIDARGLGLLLELAYCADAGSTLHFVGASPRVMRLVRLTGLDAQLSFRRRRMPRQPPARHKFARAETLMSFGPPVKAGMVEFFATIPQLPGTACAASRLHVAARSRPVTAHHRRHLFWGCSKGSVCGSFRS